MAEKQRLNDVLPPSDGWVCFLPNYAALESDEEAQRRLRAFIKTSPEVHITLSGTWDDLDG